MNLLRAFVLILFYYYNPGEQMAWYYVVPDVLLQIQTMVSFYFVLRWLQQPMSANLITAIFTVGVLLHSWMDVYGGWYYMQTYLNNFEVERAQVGDDLAKITSPQDTVFAAHGLPVRKTSAYVLDMSGLNSKLATSYRINLDTALAHVHPKYGVHHFYWNVAETMNRFPYTIRQVYYGITLYNNEPFTLFERVDPGSDAPTHHEALSTERIRVDAQPGSDVWNLNGTTFSLDLNGTNTRSLFFGVEKKADAVPLSIYVHHATGESDTLHMTAVAKQPERFASQVTQTFQVELKPNIQSVDIVASQPIHLLYPIAGR